MRKIPAIDQEHTCISSCTYMSSHTYVSSHTNVPGPLHKKERKRKRKERLKKKMYWFISEVFRLDGFRENWIQELPVVFWGWANFCVLVMISGTCLPSVTQCIGTVTASRQPLIFPEAQKRILCSALYQPFPTLAWGTLKCQVCFESPYMVQKCAEWEVAAQRTSQCPLQQRPL